ncbi:hypothetical protein ACHAPT_009050 [Fusarium lateritium]
MPAIPKKRKIGDVNRIPRASDMTSVSSSSLAPSEHSNVPSGSSSPRKQIMSLRLRLDDGGLECRQVNSDEPPPIAADLVQEFAEIHMGIGILPSEMKSTITDHLQQENRNLRLWRLAFQDGGADTLPGAVPAWDDLATVRERARDCFNEGREEASWNMEVHHRLLEKVFRGPAAAPGHPLDFMACTSTLSVNHTDYAPLQLRPIVLSIETKRPGKDLDMAQLQMGVWHAAQWRFLRSVLTQRVDAVDEATASNLADEALLELGYLPGVIIRGHHWLFVFSTLERRITHVEGHERKAYRTVLWIEQEFGSTQTILESYQVVAGIRRLAGWAADVYMPWYRRHVLLQAVEGK